MKRNQAADVTTTTKIRTSSSTPGKIILISIIFLRLWKPFGQQTRKSMKARDRIPPRKKLLNFNSASRILRLWR